MLRLLKQPYPLEKNFRIVFPRLLFFVLIVYFILVIYRPFGLREHTGTDLFFYSGGFVICGLIYLVFHFFVIESFFKEERWTLGKEILNNLLMVLAVGFVNALYYSLYEGDGLNWKVILVFEFYTLVISILPLLFSVVIRQNNLLRYHSRKADDLNAARNDARGMPTDDCELILESKNPEKQLALKCSNLVLLKAQDNYILVYWVDDGKAKQELIRNTMKNCAERLSGHSMFFRCHRSYIINMNAVESVSGNAQGLRLKLKSVDEGVPVSRHLVKEFSRRSYS